MDRGHFCTRLLVDSKVSSSESVVINSWSDFMKVVVISFPGDAIHTCLGLMLACPLLHSNPSPHSYRHLKTDNTSILHKTNYYGNELNASVSFMFEYSLSDGSRLVKCCSANTLVSIITFSVTKDISQLVVHQIRQQDQG